ncbi:SMC-Scp complex subunit ScpB [Alsobacter sp. SYSU M60028]|uniref:SMC-Scp complex subunit ScpB n=1 Tax=Alsobacter ponti TaxID=2962936 RepID=A0ABT1LEJ6_9HYPH|nr:SMC-Scp complex subunit ScpB [Alsobacter ponti]MCP8939351.1 SMC-Scp complex subunit ScpB [Alsobacter ponti]
MKSLAIAIQDDEAEALTGALEAVARDVAEDAAALRAFGEACRIGEALLFASSEPLAAEAIASRLPGDVPVLSVLRTLQKEYASRGVNLVELAGKWAFRTADDLGYLLSREAVEPRKLSRAALETLSIIAYHQPVTRAEIEDIRGVSLSRGTLDVLLETGWVRLRGRRRAPGRPVTYGTTEQFLVHFGLSRIDDLPGLDELKGSGFLDGRLPPGFGVPAPSDDPALREDEDPLGDDLFTEIAREVENRTDEPLDSESTA